MALPIKRPTRARTKYPFQGYVSYQGVDIDIENRAGTFRRGTSDEGVKWATRMHHHYGEVRGTVGADGDPVDVFVGPDAFAPYVWVVQSKYPGSPDFDETKSMLGFVTKAAAVSAFRQAYDKRGFFLDVTRWPFGAWRAAMARPRVQAGKMDRPLTKATVQHMVPVRNTGPGADNEDVDVVGDKIAALMDEGKPQKQSIAIALDEVIENGYVKEGDLIILVSFGAGLTWGINLIRL